MKLKIIIPAIVTAFLIFSMASCDQFLNSLLGVSIEDRIAEFQETLNTEARDNILDHIHPEMKNRNQLKDEKVIDESPLAYANQPFKFGAPVVSDDDVATCSFSNGNDAEGTIEFAMSLDGYDYKILKLKLTLDNAPPGDEVFELKRFLERKAAGEL